MKQLTYLQTAAIVPEVLLSLSVILYGRRREWRISESVNEYFKSLRKVKISLIRCKKKCYHILNQFTLLSFVSPGNQEKIKAISIVYCH